MLNKKALRKFADANPALAIPASHGLLHAQQVAYILRTAIKLIDHRRTLVLYIYDRKQAADGNFTPVWTMFQAGDDYITLARKGDGSTCWREAAFERLGKSYYFISQCAFYSVQDEQRVCVFFHDQDRDGITALLRTQQAILDKRALERQHRREKDTIRRMSALHALPRGLKGWARRSVMPAYFRCEHASVRRPVTGVCTSCGKESTLPSAVHNSKIVCPHCGRELTVKSAGKTGCHFDRDTVQAVEKISDTEIVVRIAKVYYSYDRDHLMPTMKFRENARIFVRRGPDGKTMTEPYYYSYSRGDLTHWMPGTRPVFPYSDGFEASTYGHVYCRNLPAALAGTPWEYCPVAAFYEHFREPMQLQPFLAAHLSRPRLEHLVKVGFFDLASDLAYGRVQGGLLDETRNRTHQLLRVSAGDVSFLREQSVDAEDLSMFRECPDCGNRQRLFLWRREHGVSRDVKQCLEHVTPHKLMKYAGQQFAILAGRKSQFGRLRYENMQDVVSEYRDYLGMCADLDYSMNSSFILFPKDLQKSHDEAARRTKIKADAQMHRDFKAAMKAIAGRLDFEADGMKLLLPAAPEDLAAEGNALHHCVGSYAKRVAKKECVILFLRRCDALDKPFYTIEIRGSKIIQVQGMRHCNPTPEVGAFVAQWERQVLQAPAAA